MVGKFIVVKQEMNEEQESTRFDDQAQHNVSNAAEQQKIIAKTKVDGRTQQHRQEGQARIGPWQQQRSQPLIFAQQQ